MSKITNYQLRQMLCSLTGERVDDYTVDEDMSSCISSLAQNGKLHLPWSYHYYVIPERTAIFAAITKPRSSWLIQQMLDRPSTIAIVVDSILTGPKALHFAELCLTECAVQRIHGWTSCMKFGRPISLTVRPVDEEYTVIIVGAVSLVQ